VQSQRFLLIFSVMAPTAMMMLNSTIVNVSVPVIAGELGATSDTISWVLTSYLIAMSIVLPLTGYLTDRLGRRGFLLVSIAGFALCSELCGLATGLHQLVLFRFLQGMFGAAFVPLSRTILSEAFPRSQAGRAMAIWGMGVVVAPILGPTLGGYITEALTWRWIFHINLPIGLVSFLLAARYAPSTERKERRMDWLGLASLAIAVGALQLVLDRGHREDWFESTAICIEAGIAAVAFLVFLVHGLRPKSHPIFDLGVFKDRNFSIGSLVMGATGVSMFGGNFLQPLFLENLLAFPAMTAGMVLMFRGIGSFISMNIAGRLSDKMNPKWLALPGVLSGMLGSYLMARYNMQVDMVHLLVPTFLQGMGIGLIWVPVSALAFSTLPSSKSAEASGIYSLIRSVTAAIGVSMTSTYFARAIDSQWSLLRGHVNPFNPAVQAYLQPLDLQPYGQGIAVLARTVATQSQLSAFVDSFWFITASFALMIPLVLLLRDRGHARLASVSTNAE
jgi:DHA2 family multidrug resistance protein